ncbi:hypothetical protein ACHAW6_004479 [Cyclotella cf. meneghiniana]
MMRGITNTSRTACHTSSTLQLLYHCFPLLRRALLDLASIASRERRRRIRRHCRNAKASTKREQGQPSEQEKETEEEEWERELVYQLSWFFRLLTHGHSRNKDEDAHHRSIQHDEPTSALAHSSPKNVVRKRMKQPLTPTQKQAVHNFMKSSEEGRRGTIDDDWKKLVSAMRECNRATYENVLGMVLAGESGAASSSGLGAVDPTEFFEHLTRYTSDVSKSHSIVTAIHPTAVGDASSVFRSLCHALDYSTEREYGRVKSQCEMLEVEQWNNDGREGGGGEKQRRRLERWKGALEKVGDAIKVEWKGALLSRIVGTCLIHESVGLKPQMDGSVASEHDKGTITTIILQRTKKNGDIERPIPIPFPLPVIQRIASPQQRPIARENQHVENEKSYYPSLISSLYSVTIQPNPIRGYDWRDLMKRGEVVEEKLVQNREHATEQDSLVDNALMDETKYMNSDESEGRQCYEKNKKVHLDGLAVVQACLEEKKSQDDNISLASRSIGVQTDFSEMAGDSILIPRGLVDQGNHLESTDKAAQKETDTTGSVDNAEMNQGPPPPPQHEDNDQPMRKSNHFVEKNALYAAAVAAITSSPSKRRGRRISLQNITTRNSTAFSYGAATFCGVEVGGASYAAANISPLELGPGLVVKDETVSSSSLESVESGLSPDSNSIEESTVNSKVSSVKSDSSYDYDDGNDSSTHSSAIDTPSDIDELSLGSFTDSEDKALKENPAPKVPMLDDENEETNPSDHVDLSDSLNPITSVELTQSARSSPSNVSEVLDSDGSSSAESSSDDSSTSSSDTFPTESSNTSGDEESSSSDENLSNDLSESFAPGNDEASDHIGNKQDWVTKKETRFCHPLPHNIVFHLKRFEYSNTLGRVETLAGELNIPNELDLKPCCLDPSDHLMGNATLKDCCYRYSISGAIVHVNPMENEAEKVYGEAAEGHYVTFVNASTSFSKGSSGPGDKNWFEIDDDRVRPVDDHASNIIDEGDKQSMSDKQLALRILSGCDFVTSKAGSCSGVDKNGVKEKERRYATLVVYSRNCDCCRRRT